MDIPPSVKDALFVFYVLTEVLFYTWFINKISIKPFTSKSLWISNLMIIFFWALSYFILEDSNDSDIYCGLFDGTTAIFISSLAAHAIFLMTQKSDQIFKSSSFWFASGVFFYFFCNVFIFTIISKEVAETAWDIHRFLNTITMFVFAFGFYKLSHENRRIAV